MRNDDSHERENLARQLRRYGLSIRGTRDLRTASTGESLCTVLSIFPGAAYCGVTLRNTIDDAESL